MPGLHIAELMLWKGKVRIIVTGPDGRREEVLLDNLITDAGKNLLRDALMTGTTDCEIRYVALGSSNAAPAAGQTQLGAEFFRKQVTKQEAGGAGVLTTTVYIAPYEANQQIEEIGWFAGPGATGAANSGIMVARVLYSRLKNQLESLEIQRTDTIS